MKTRAVFAFATLAVVLVSLPARLVSGSTYSGPAAGGSWGTAADWTGGIPNSPGAVADFSTNPATVNRTITNDGSAAGRTVGTITFAGTSTFSNTLSTGTTGSVLKFDNSGAGATVTTNAGGTGNNTISVAMVLNDSVTANVNNTTATSGAHSLNLTGTMSGTGGFTKAGDGGATFGTGTKTYTGPTSITGGRLRMSLAAAATGTSSFTINGGQLTMIAAGSFTLGPGSVNLNGAGPTTGPFAPFPGALRQDTNLVTTITNPVNLQSASVIHVQGSASGSLTLSGVVSGVGKLTFTAPSSDANIGQLVLTGANSYSGGTLVNGGTLVVSGAGATLGTGNVEVNNAASIASTAVLSLLAGVSNAIADGAMLSLAGGLAGKANLGAGIDDLVGSLVLGGITQTSSGTYGSTLSGATFQNDTYFTGMGVVRLTAVPEASSFLCVIVAGAAVYFGRKLFGRRSA